MLWHLGRRHEAEDSLNAALAILNKAIRANDKDAESHSERAAVFEDMGEADLAIADVKPELALSEKELGIYFIRRRLGSLRRKAALR